MPIERVSNAGPKWGFNRSKQRRSSSKSRRTTASSSVLVAMPITPRTRTSGSAAKGDVAIHAVCDALLGAAALGDIGQHFPDTSDDYAGIDSKLLLGRVAAMLRERSYEIGNVDCTIRMQRPKLRPYIDAMRAAMAGAMGIDTERVSVKATTTEHLGFEGREEGVSVSAVALIFRP